MIKVLLLLTSALLVHSIRRYDGGEHGNIFNKLANTEKLTNKDGSHSMAISKFVAMFGDFVSTCAHEDVICKDETRADDLMKSVVNTYYLATKDEMTEFMDKFDGMIDHEVGGMDLVDLGILKSANKPGKVGGDPGMMYWFKYPALTKKTECKSYNIAFYNTDHFSTCAKITWERFLMKGLTMWCDKTKDANLALLYITAGLHYATDQFSAGHVRVPALTIREYCDNFATAGKTIEKMHYADGDAGITVWNNMNSKSHNSWLQFGDHYLFSPKNKQAKDALGEFISHLDTRLLELRVKKRKECRLTIKKVVDESIDMLPVWRWSIKEIMEYGCPVYITTQKEIKDGDTLVFRRGEILKPDIDIKTYKKNKILRLIYQDEKPKDTIKLAINDGHIKDSGCLYTTADICIQDVFGSDICCNDENNLGRRICLPCTRKWKPTKEYLNAMDRWNKPL